MTERLKDGQIVGIVAGEGGIHRRKLEINLMRVSSNGEGVKLQFPEDRWLIEADYTPSDTIGVQHTFPELETDIISLKVKLPEKNEKTVFVAKDKYSSEADKDTVIVPETQLSFPELTSY